MKLLTFRNLSFLAYVLLGSAIFGYASLGDADQRAAGSTDSGLVWVWVIIGFIGSLLGVAKNQLVEDRGLRIRLYLSDLGVVVLALVLAAVLPSNLGLLKGLASGAVFAGYYVWYQKDLAEHLSA